jgi:predicted MFS family arabinose efflux permease
MEEHRGMRSKHRWFVLFVLYLFVLLHQADKLLIGPLTTPIMEDFGITQTQMGAVSTLAILVAAVLYPVWGYLFDRYARSKLLALASFVWGATTWLNALARRYGVFLLTRASTGIDDSSYPGIYSLLADYFGPAQRGRIYGVLQTAMPFGYMLGLVLATVLQQSWGWRSAFFLTGSVGIVVAALIFFFVREAPRGRAEPEMANVAEMPTFEFDPQVAKSLLKRRSMALIFAQGFFGVFPWNVLTFWAFRYLETERGLSGNQAMVTMMISIVLLAGGYFLGGSVGDALFRRKRTGRIIAATTGVIVGAVGLGIAVNIPLGQHVLFVAMLGLTCLAMSVAAPNVTATIQDVAEPEVRSTALAMQSFIENGGAALSPLLAGMIADRWSLKVAILAICLVTWALCALFFGLLMRHLPADIDRLREVMRRRAEAAVEG